MYILTIQRMKCQIFSIDLKICQMYCKTKKAYTVQCTYIAYQYLHAFYYRKHVFRCSYFACHASQDLLLLYTKYEYGI